MVSIAPKRTRYAKTKAARRDLSRAPLMVAIFVWAIASLLYFTTGSEQITREGEFVFGRQSRIGSIIFTPLFGDVCQRSAFDNDSGLVLPLGAIPCVEILALLDEGPKDTAQFGHFAAIRNNFHK